MTFVSRCDTVNQLSMQIESSSDMAPIFSIKSCHNVKLHRHHALNVFMLKHWVRLDFIVKPKAKLPTANLVVKLYSPILLTNLLSENKKCIEYRELGLKIKSPTTYHINDCSGPYLLPRWMFSRIEWWRHFLDPLPPLKNSFTTNSNIYIKLR